ncbi:MAG TPA: peptide chain release factor N(5)-glutamine methyltransferase [Syntrophobacteria bacterium]|nr:peptide chain release factor N(5)-glutamine methyltransferase [Syntrophobacteria bacterium]
MPETVLSLLRRAADHLKNHHILEPRAAAELLLGHVLGLDRLSLYLNAERPLEAGELKVFSRCLERRLRGEPVQYITGTQEFWSLALAVTPAVLIPRPETELLVEALLDLARDTGTKQMRLMDMGTGSGAIAIAAARELPQALVVAGDCSLAALGVAKDNARRYQVSGRVLFLCSDLFSGLGRIRFDAVVTNPPYIKSSEFSLLPREIRDYEPRHALDGGEDGLQTIRAIIDQAPNFLRSGGILALEMGTGQAEAVGALVARTNRYRGWRIFKDYSAIDRVLVAQTR